VRLQPQTLPPPPPRRHRPLPFPGAPRPGVLPTAPAADQVRAASSPRRRGHKNPNYFLENAPRRKP
jgi:hypothetical protein